MLILPPPGVAPEVLFRRFVVPKPRLRLDFRFKSFQHPALWVEALTTTEIVAAIEGCSESEALVNIIPRSLTAGGEFVFGDVDELLDLPDPEVDALIIGFGKAFREICPISYQSDWHEWLSELKKGAQHHTNERATVLLGQCYEAATFGNRVRILDRPDRYFGVQMHRLTDGQMMAYRAARALHEDRMRSSE